MDELESELLRGREVARLLGMSPAWVYIHLKAGAKPRLPHVRIGHSVRFRRVEIEAFMHDNSRPVEGGAESLSRK